MAKCQGGGDTSNPRVPAIKSIGGSVAVLSVPGVEVTSLDMTGADPVVSKVDVESTVGAVDTVETKFTSRRTVGIASTVTTGKRIPWNPFDDS